MPPMIAALRRLLGPEGVLSGAAELALYARDAGFYESGLPAAVALPSSTAETARLVRWARARRAALTPAGARSSFWNSTPAGGRVIVDLRRLSGLLSLDPVERTARVGGGTTLEALERALTPKGWCLPVAPDGPAETTAASLLVNDVCVGRGMFLGPARRWIVGATAVTGAGEVLPLGACGALSFDAAFARSGLPDLTGLFLACEGALGVVTELTLRVAPVLRIETLESPVEATRVGLSRVLAAFGALRSAGGCHDWIVQNGTDGWTSRLRVASEDADTLAFHRAKASEALARAGVPEARVYDSGVTRWQPRPGGAGLEWKGVALALPHARVLELFDVWSADLERALPKPAMFRLYLGPESAAVVVGWNHAPSERARHEKLAARVRKSVGGLGVPYRWGQVWGEALSSRLDPRYRAVLRELKSKFDPDGIMNPGVGVYASAKKR